MKPEVEIQLIDFADRRIELAAMRRLLSEKERARAERFLRESDARSYIISHAKLRQLLAERLGCALKDLVIAIDEHGKPFLNADLGQALYFNLSHAGRYALVAMSKTSPVGVDIEKINSKVDFLAIAERFFTSQECAYINDREVEQQADIFFRIWTLKEAYVKAIGRGLAYGLDKFSVISSQQLATHIEDCQIQSIATPSGYSGAVAFMLHK